MDSLRQALLSCIPEAELNRLRDLAGVEDRDVRVSLSTVLSKLGGRIGVRNAYYLEADDYDMRCDLTQIILIFTADGGVVVGYATTGDALALLRKEMDSYGVRWGVVWGETYPPDTIAEFKMVCSNTVGIDGIVDGVLTLNGN